MATAIQWKRYLDNETNATEEIDSELPFRFTQYQLNPQGKASSGQSTRTAIGRSPFTSGALGQELKGLESQLREMGEVAEPGDIPTPPEFPEALSNPVQESSQQEMPSLTNGMPTRSYEVPNSLLEGFTGNPRALALQYEQGKFGKLEGPTTSFTGYDVPGMVGADKWASILKGHGGKRGSEERALFNLSIIPTNFDPQLNKTSNLRNLAELNFARQEMLNPMKNIGNYEGTERREAGYDVPDYVPRTSAYTDDELRSMLQTNREDSGFNKFMSTALPTGLLAGMAALTGGAAGAAMGGAGGGLGGAVGFSGGQATAINMGAGIGASLLSNAGLSAAGVDMNHPVARLAGAGIGGAMGGLISGAGAPGTDYGSTTAAELRPTTIYDYLERNNLSPGDLMDMMGEDKFIAAFGDPNKFTQGYDTYSGVASPLQNSAGNLGRTGQGKLATGLLEAAAQGYAATQPSGAGGLAGSVYDEAELAAYSEAYGAYENDILKYIEELDKYNQYQQTLDEYNALLNKYNTQSQNYSNRQMAMARREGLKNQISSNIAENPFYDPRENYTGIQQSFLQ